MRSLDGFAPIKPEKLALYPQTKTRAVGMYFGSMLASESQQALFSLEVHVFVACPFSPWIATIL
jgi:hypothetical protein